MGLKVGVGLLTNLEVPMVAVSGSTLGWVGMAFLLMLVLMLDWAIGFFFGMTAGVQIIP